MNQTKQQLKTDATKPKRRAAHDVLKSEPANFQDQPGSINVKSHPDSASENHSYGPGCHRLSTDTARMDCKKLEAEHSKFSKLLQRVENAALLAVKADLDGWTPLDRKQYIEETINKVGRVQAAVHLENERCIAAGLEQIERALRDAASALKPESMKQKIGQRTPACA